MEEPQGLVEFEESEIDLLKAKEEQSETLIPEATSKNKSYANFKKNEQILLIGLVVFVIFSFATPFLLTRNGLICLDFTKSGNIGDTIGGITAPFFSLLGSVLVYFSFRAQMQMNIIQMENLEDQQRQIKEQKARIKAQEEEKKYEKQRETMMTLSNVIFKNSVSIMNLFIMNFSSLYEDLEKAEFLGINVIKNYSTRDIESKTTDFNMIYNLLHPIWHLNTLELLQRDDRLLLYSLDAVKWGELEIYLEKSIKVFNYCINQPDHSFDNFREKFSKKPKLESYLSIISSLTN